MSKTVTLKATKRDVVGKQVDKFRKQDLVPAVVYGNKIEPVNVWVYFKNKEIQDLIKLSQNW